MTESAVKLENLTIGYSSKQRNTTIASGINETVEQGSLVCICGPNGGGKSTLLKTLCRFLKPLEGEVYVYGQPLRKMTPLELSRNIGVVLTQRQRFNALTGRELVAIGRAPYTGFFGRLSKTDDKAIDEAIRATGAERFSHSPVEQLSDGERQKLLIAKALAQNTPVIVLDEPTAFLDYPSKVEIMELLKDLCRNSGKTVFISTHDLDIAFAVTDILWLINKDRGIITGTVSQLGDNGDIERFFHSPSLTFDAAQRRFKIKSA